MQKSTVKSTSIAEVGYEPAESTLQIQFQSGSTYDYFGVPEAVYSGLLEADSAGRFFQENVVGEFDYQRA